jgi:subtilisin family serine protease
MHRLTPFLALLLCAVGSCQSTAMHDVLVTVKTPAASEPGPRPSSSSSSSSSSGGGSSSSGGGGSAPSLRALAAAAARQSAVADMQLLRAAAHEPVVQLLSDHPGQHTWEAFWIAPIIHVRSPSATLLRKLERHPSVAKVEREKVYSAALVGEIRGKPQHVREADGNCTSADCWGVSLLGASAAWDSQIQGEGIVVATIDTGVRSSHESLAAGFRGGQHSWFDAINGSAAPHDDNGHGTLTTALVAGSHGVGMAPGAQWIACKGLNASGQGTDAQLIKCGQWIACPTDPSGGSSNCSAAPNVVSSSWGDGDEDHPGQGHTTFEPVLEAWKKLGIVAVFAAGNSGDNCTTVVSPADLADAIAVGGTDRYDYLAGWSSKGPPLKPGGEFGTQKPEVVAPGASIVSASNTKDDGYSAASGTSLSCPHVAGTVALLLSADGSHTIDSIR